MFGLPDTMVLKWMNEVRIWGAALAALAAAVTFVANYYSTRLQSTVSAAKDEEFTRFRISSAERTAAAQAEAARANERAAELERSAAEARTEQERLRENTARLELSLERERRQRVELQQRLAWRRLTVEQHDAIVAALHGQTFQIWVGTLRADPEAVMFWEDIVQTLKDAGLEVVAHTAYERALGLSLTPRDNPEHEALKRAFEAAGLPLAAASGDSLRGDKLEIVVGSKPPPF